MTARIDVVNYVHTRTQLTHKESEKAVNTILLEMKKALKAGNNIIIRGFGEFKVKHKNERIGRNPRTGEPALVTARRVTTWKASKQLKARMNDG